MSTPRHRIPLFASALTALLSCAAAAHDPPSDSHDPAAFAQMRHAANLFLKSLDEKQRARAQMKFDDSKRSRWSYLPDKFIKPEGQRFGLPVKDMNHQQQLLAYGLLHSALSHRGSLTAHTIMALEEVLHELENGNPIRDTQRYYFSVFGSPSSSQSWSWRVEGHHLSINVTLVDGHHLAVTPSFFGANPGIVKSGPLAGVHALDREENLGRKLARSLTDAQRKKAIVLAKAPADIFSKDRSKVDRDVFDLTKGIPFGELTAEQQKLLTSLVRNYVNRFRPDLLKHLASTPLGETDSMIFAWAGSLKPGEGHYYRIVTKNHLIEYDNVQNGANHPHCVWRVFDGDFGEDLLRQHHLQHHGQNAR